MPIAAPTPCRQPGCGALVRDGSGRCESHKVAPGSFGDRLRGSRQQRGYGAAWDKLRVRILRRDSGLCRPCLAVGRVTVATAVDHVVPRSRGGSDDESNLQSICNDCHRIKTQAEANAGRGA